MKSFVAFLMVLMALIPPAARAAERSSRWHKVWLVSQAMLVAGNTADIASSWGKYETNPLLHTGTQFSYGSMAIKLGMMSAGVVAQYYLARKSPEQIPYFTAANMAVAGALSMVALHNTGVPAALH